MKELLGTKYDRKKWTKYENFFKIQGRKKTFFLENFLNNAFFSFISMYI